MLRLVGAHVIANMEDRVIIQTNHSNNTSDKTRKRKGLMKTTHIQSTIIILKTIPHKVVMENEWLKFERLIEEAKYLQT